MKKEFVVLILVLIVLISGCVQKECKVKEDCPDKTCFTKDCIDYNCSYSQIIPCCGNGICEIVETYETCADDCPNCNDNDKCTEDSFDYDQHECVNKELIPCCGNGICETGETYKECADDCVKSGVLDKDETWSGTIHVTGDIDVLEGTTLTILPGTVIKVALTDDQHKGSDEPLTGDIYFPKDPPFYFKQKITITIHGILNAVGTPDNKIIFTSASENPTTYDWWGIDIFHGRLEYAIVEYGQGNIQLQHSSDVVISNNVIRNSLGCCVCIGHSNQVSPQILNNEIYNCGHEGIDLAGGSALIKGNYFHLENPEIQPDPLRGENGIIVYTNTYPIIEDNVFENLTNAITFLGNSKYPEESGEKVIIKNNRLEDNIIAFRINPGYPFEVVVRENNNLINNEKDEVYSG